MIFLASFFFIALMVSAVFGFGWLYVSFAWFFRIIFWVFLIGMIVALIMALVNRGKKPQIDQ
jgi:hypothetical protein